MTTVFFRTIILYFLVIISLRAMGKRQVGELSASEFVVTLLVSELATLPMQSNDTPLFTGIIPVLTLVALELIISYIFIHSRKIRKLTSGRTNIIIENGKLNQKEMKKIRLTIDELLEELRLKGFISIEEVKYAILETSGELSVFPFASKDTAKREDVGITNDTTFLPYTLISDGVFIKKQTELLGKNEAWVKNILSKKGITSYSEVFLMQADLSDNVIVIEKQKN